MVADIEAMRRLVRRIIDDAVPFTISTDGPEMLHSYLRNELNLLLRNEILTLDEAREAIRRGHAASFLNGIPAIESSLGDRALGAAPIAVEVGG